MAFVNKMCQREPLHRDKKLLGNSTHSFFSPHPGYAVSQRKNPPQGIPHMVKALHRAGIGVIWMLPQSYVRKVAWKDPRSISRDGNRVFTISIRTTGASTVTTQGGGNTVNCNSPCLRISCRLLEYWVQDMHVDGFRFDLAVVLVRDQNGAPCTCANAVEIEFSKHPRQHNAHR